MTHKIHEQPKPGRQKQTKTPKHVTPEDSTPQTKFSDHVAELRRRVFFVAIVFLLASALAYNYKDVLLQVIMSPLAGERLVYLTPGGGFNFIFQISMYAGLIAAAPMFIYQLYGFIRPALPAKAQRSSLTVVVVAFLLMLCGVAFGYFVAVPSALHFLSEFAGSAVSPNLTADSYLGFFLAYIAGLGVLFELPLLLLFFHWIHPMTPGKLLKSERFVILFAFIAAALITPTPDVINQAMVAVPLILIYQLGVVAVLIAIRKERRKIAGKLQDIPSGEIPKPVTSALPSVQEPQPVLVTVPLSHERVTSKSRSLDGFTRTTRPSVRSVGRLTPPPRRQITPETRHVQRSSVPRRSLSIDGFPMS